LQIPAPLGGLFLTLSFKKGWVKKCRTFNPSKKLGSRKTPSRKLKGTKKNPLKKEGTGSGEKKETPENLIFCSVDRKSGIKRKKHRPIKGEATISLQGVGDADNERATGDLTSLDRPRQAEKFEKSRG